jgi:hypothetical protein
LAPTPVPTASPSPTESPAAIPGGIDAGPIAAIGPTPTPAPTASPGATRDAGMAPSGPDGGTADEGPADPVPAPSIETEVADEAVDQSAPPADEPEPPDPAPQKMTIAEAERLIKEGQREAAIRALYKLRRANPKSAYIHYLIGNLYFEKLWWTDGMESYVLAIKHDRNYRKRATLIKNAIRALAKKKTQRKAAALLYSHVGRVALPYLDRAAKSSNQAIRGNARWLAGRLRKRR